LCLFIRAIPKVFSGRLSNYRETLLRRFKRNRVAKGSLKQTNLNGKFANPCPQEIGVRGSALKVKFGIAFMKMNNVDREYAV
jgi:hypothetical protein